MQVEHLVLVQGERSSSVSGSGFILRVNVQAQVWREDHVHSKVHVGVKVQIL